MKSNPNRLIDHFFQMQEEIDRLFDDFIEPSQNLTTETAHWRPPMDIYETVDSFVVKIEIAGIEPSKDLKIQLNQNVLTLKGYRQERTVLKKEHYHQAELNYGPFERSIVLPNILADDVEPVANYTNGFLEIHIPKTRVNKPKEIVVQAKQELELESPENPERRELDDGIEG